MTDIDDLNSIMQEVTDGEPEVEVLEQRDETTRGGHEELTELQEDLMEWRQMEDEEADREPQVRQEAI